MPMTADEFNAAVTDILGNVSDVGHVSQKLDELRTAFGEALTDAETRAKTIETLEGEKKSLQEANMNLFLKIGTPQKETETEQKDEPQAEPDFESLFDENGNLKKE